MNLALRRIVGESAQAWNQERVDGLAAWRASRLRLRRGGGTTDRQERRRVRWSVGIVLLVHALLFIGLQQWTRLHFEVPAEAGVIHLRLIDQPTEQNSALPAPLDPPVPLARPDAVATKVEATSPAPIEPRTTPVARRSAQAAKPADTAAVPEQQVPGVFDRSGRIMLPQENASGDPAAFGLRAKAESYRSDPMAHESPLPYKPTPFDKYWKPDGETLLGEWVRKATRKSVYDTRGGTRITCESFLFFSACAWGPIPRVTIEELKAMRVVPPMPRNSADDPYVQPDD